MIVGLVLSVVGFINLKVVIFGEIQISGLCSIALQVKVFKCPTMVNSI